MNPYVPLEFWFRSGCPPLPNVAIPYHTVYIPPIEKLVQIAPNHWKAVPVDAEPDTKKQKI